MVQQIRPDADIAAGGWGPAPLYSKIDEASAGGDVISSDGGGPGSFTINSPTGAETVGDTFVAAGTGTNMQSYRARIDTGTWFTGSGTDNWYVEVDASALAAGNHTLTVEGTDTNGTILPTQTKTIAAVAAVNRPLATETFECCGFAWRYASGSSAITATPYFRKAGAGSAWQQGMDLWWDNRTTVLAATIGPEYRGSIVYLEEGATYEAKIVLSNGTVALVSFKTWTDTPAIQSTTTVPTGTVAAPRTTTYVVTTGGGVVGGVEQYVKYVPTSPTQNVIDGNNAIGNCIEVKASYVIIDGFDLRDAQRNGVYLANGVHHVRIQNCDISGFGREGTTAPPTGPGNTDAGYIGYGRQPINSNTPASNDTNGGDGGVWGYSTNVDANKITQIVVQRCKIHDPRWSSTFWNTFDPNAATGSLAWSTHPEGPVGIAIGGPLLNQGNNVYRYNEVWSTNGNYFYKAIQNDPGNNVVGCNDNDIYGNSLKNVADDAIECDGGSRNVRIWNNYVDDSFTGFSFTPNTVGPCYVFRNVFDTHRINPITDTDLDGRGPIFKIGTTGGGSFGGRTYFFHNTQLQRNPAAGKTYTLGSKAGLNANNTMREYISRNNLYIVRWNASTGAASGAWLDAFGTGGDNTNDIQYDVAHGTPTTDTAPGGSTIVINNNEHGRPTFASGHGNNNGGGGQYQLASGSPGYGNATPLVNFNDMYASPDKGAAQHGDLAMRYGVLAG